MQDASARDPVRMPSPDAKANHKRDNTTPSCAVCNRRKVKCDRVYPCAPCRKTGLECTFPEPARKRARRKPPSPEPATAHRASSNEGGVLPGKSSHGTNDNEHAPHGTRRLLGGILYEVDGGQDARASRTTARSTGADRRFDLLLGQRESLHYDLTAMPPEVMEKVADAYRSHVDPVVKVFQWRRQPASTGDTFQDPTLNDAALDLTKSIDCCLFRAICFVTAVATEGATLAGGKGASIATCRAEVELALSENDFRKSKDLRILQALMLYLIGLQSLGEDEVVWMLLGVAIRIASVLGLPHDIGDEASSTTMHSPYQIEMMRRVWWAILALDARVTRILGRTGYLSHNFRDVARPANIDEDSLIPDMSHMPPDLDGLTDSSYVRYRATLSDVLPFIYGSGDSKDRCTDIIQMIDDAEQQIEHEFIRHCDKRVPLHLLTFVAGRGYIMRVKLAFYSIFPTDAVGSPEVPYASEGFWLAKESMELFIMLWTNSGMEPWQWHWKDFFGWHTLRILVKEIAKRSSCSKAIDAWKLVKQAATLAVPALKLGEEKAGLVGDLRMFIEAADVRSHAGESYAYATGAMVPSIRPGMGTNPHNAMFPGMNTSFGDIGDERVDRSPPTNVPTEFDLKRVNWTEMDRILLQLGTYTGS